MPSEKREAPPRRVNVKISQVISLIPEDTMDEALLAIETVTLLPATNSARLRCILSREFTLHIQVNGDAISITAESWPTVNATAATLLPALKRAIYEIDEAAAAGRYKQSPVKPNIIDIDSRTPAPGHMDIPMWDEARGQWYDAEY